jgi:hypothetical protein
MSNLKGIDASKLTQGEKDAALQSHIKAFEKMAIRAKEGNFSDILLINMFGSLFKLFLANIMELKGDSGNERMIQLAFMSSCSEYTAIGIEEMINCEHCSEEE